MLKENVLPADTFIVINRTILNDQDRKLLTMLYQPIIGQTAISLYFTLWAYLDRNEIISLEWTHHHLMTSMRIKLSEIVEAREKLEGIGLLKSYVKKGNINHFAYELYSPLSAHEFINNPVLDTSLYNNVGISEYEKIISYFEIPKMNLREYTDITCSFNEVFESTNLNSYDHVIQDIKKRNTNKLSITSKIDLDTIFSSIPEEMFNQRSITKDTKELLYKISFIYDFDDEKMVELIRNSLTDKRTIDKNLLKKNSKKVYQFENFGKLPSLLYRNQPEYLRKPVGDTSKKAKIIYQFETTTPYDFLSSKYDGIRLSKSDIGTLEYLLVDMNLKPGVVNVLIDYVLKINNNKLTRSFIEAIASQWARSKVETVEAAMNLAEKENRNRKTYTEKKQGRNQILEEKPIWFEKNIEKNKASKEEIEEMENLLSEFK